MARAACNRDTQLSRREWQPSIRAQQLHASQGPSLIRVALHSSLAQRVPLPVCTRVVSAPVRAASRIVCQGVLRGRHGPVWQSQPHSTQHGPGPERALTGDTLRVRAAAAEAVEFKGDLLNTSYYPTSADAANTNKEWFVINAEGQTLGRLASLAATYIR